MNAVLVEPYFARLPKERLKSHYLIAVAAAADMRGWCNRAGARLPRALSLGTRSKKCAG